MGDRVRHPHRQAHRSDRKPHPVLAYRVARGQRKNRQRRDSAAIGTQAGAQARDRQVNRNYAQAASERPPRKAAEMAAVCLAASWKCAGSASRGIAILQTVDAAAMAACWKAGAARKALARRMKVRRPILPGLGGAGLFRLPRCVVEEGEGEGSDIPQVRSNALAQNKILYAWSVFEAYLHPRPSRDLPGQFARRPLPARACGPGPQARARLAFDIRRQSPTPDDHGKGSDRVGARDSALPYSPS